MQPTLDPHEILSSVDDFEREADDVRPFRERTSPRWVDPKQGANPATRFELAALVVGIVVLVAGGFFVGSRVADIFADELDLTIVDGSTSLRVLVDDDGNGCTWTLDFRFRNLTDDGVRISSFEVVPRHPSFRFDEQSDVTASTITHESAAQIAYRLRDCSDPPTETGSLRLMVTYTRADGSSRTESLDLD